MSNTAMPPSPGNPKSRHISGTLAEVYNSILVCRVVSNVCVSLAERKAPSSWPASPSPLGPGHCKEPIQEPRFAVFPLGR